MEKMLALILEKMDDGFQTVEKRLNRMNQRFEGIEGRLDNLEGRFDKLEERFDKFETEQKRHEELLHQLIATDVKISETNTRFDSLEIKVNEIGKDIEEIKEKMATKEDLEYYDQMISEHAREIYKLKNR